MLYFCGFFPKLIQPVAPGFEGLGLVEICSVSCCVVPAPARWIDAWLHNDLGLFDTVERAESVIPSGEPHRYEVFGYRFFDQAFDEGEQAAWAPPVLPEPVDADFEPLGFDAVSRSTSSFFECSPLSCNTAAKTMVHNEHCLFHSLDEAVAGAKAFSLGGAEPGPYYVAQVLRRRRGEARLLA